MLHPGTHGFPEKNVSQFGPPVWQALSKHIHTNKYIYDGRSLLHTGLPTKDETAETYRICLVLFLAVAGWHQHG